MLDFSPIENFLIKALSDELKAQGHNMTGDLLKSIKVVAKAFLQGGFVIEGSFLSYGAPLNTGVKSSRIPFTQPSNVKRSKYIEGLVRFVKLRRIATDNAKALGIAFAIAKTHKKQGMPTRGSFKFSRNGRRKDWVNIVLTENEQKIFEILQGIFEDNINVIFDNFIAKTQTIVN